MLLLFIYISPNPSLVNLSNLLEVELELTFYQILLSLYLVPT